MPTDAGVYLAVGLMCVGMALAATLIRRLPLSSSLVYLCVGVVLGPHVVGLLPLDLFRDAPVIERVTEVALLVSLFAAGLNLRAPWSDPRWRLALRLAFPGMLLTILLLAGVGHFLLGFSWGLSILLGGILAPTDPVLASDVEVEHPFDPSKLRFALTGEAGLNDGAAFPFVVLGLSMLNLTGGEKGWPWAAHHLVWSTLAGLAIGWFAGMLVGKYLLHVREKHQEALGLGYFLSIGLIGVVYGTALFADANGFLAVIAAGLALRRIELQRLGTEPPEHLRSVAVEPGKRKELATDPKTGPVYLVQSLLEFTDQIEQIGEAVVVTLAGALLTTGLLRWELLWYLPLLFLLVRPLSVAVALAGSCLSWKDRGLIGWFGIRGIGSLYYLSYAIHHGLAGNGAQVVTSLVLATVSLSILVHGLSVTPLMNMYARRLNPREQVHTPAH